MRGKSIALGYCTSFLMSTVTIHANTYDIFKKHKEVEMN